LDLHLESLAILELMKRKGNADLMKKGVEVLNPIEQKLMGMGVLLQKRRQKSESWSVHFPPL